MPEQTTEDFFLQFSTENEGKEKLCSKKEELLVI